MTSAVQPTAKSTAYTRAALYYTILWGAMALAGSFIAVDLNRRGMTETEWGIISALRSLVVFLVTPMVTRFADKHKARVKVLQVVIILNAVSTLLYMLPRGFYGFLIVSLVVNFFGAGMMPLGDSIIVRMARRHDIQYGRLRLWGSIGYMIFGLLGGVLWDRVGFSYLYWVGSFITLLVVVMAARLEEPHAEKIQQPAAFEALAPARRKSVVEILKADLVLLLFLIASLLRSSGELMFFSFGAIYIDQLTDQAFFTGLINGGAAVLEIPVMMNTQRWIKRFGMENVIMAGFFIQAAGLGIFALSLNPWMMFVGSALRNVGFALYFIAAVQFVDLRAGEEDASTYQGLMSSMSWGLAPLIVSPLAGWIFQRFGGQVVFIISALTALLAAGVMVPILIKARKETRPETAGGEN